MIVGTQYLLSLTALPFVALLCYFAWHETNPGSGECMVRGVRPLLAASSCSVHIRRSMEVVEP